MELTWGEAITLIDRHGAVLDQRTRRFQIIDRYVEGPCPLPLAIIQAKVTKAYRMLMGMAETPYGRRVIKAAAGRMEVGGIRSTDPAADKAVWDAWQANRMDAESRRSQETMLAHGRVFAVVWTDDDDGASIQMESPDSVVVEYEEGSRYERVSAMRRWVDDDGGTYATLYTPDFIYKFTATTKPGAVGWDAREVDGEPWPLPNPTGVVPVVEIATGRRLKPGAYGDAVSDLDGAVGILDRINVLEFLRLVIAFTSGFPIRAVIGEKILYDDNNKPIAPFELAADVIAQLENPNVKITEIAAADLKAFGDAIDHDVQALAGITATPSYYMQSVPIQNVSADAIRASDGPLNSRVAEHKAGAGEGWEEVLRVAGLMLPQPVALPNGAAVVWRNLESRSLAERADAAVKLNGILPRQAIWELVFDMTPDEIARYEAMGMSDALTNMLNTPAPAVANGNGATTTG